MMFGAFAHSMHPDLLVLDFSLALFLIFCRGRLSLPIDAKRRWVDGGLSQAAMYVPAVLVHAERRTPQHEPRPLHNPAD